MYVLMTNVSWKHINKKGKTFLKLFFSEIAMIKEIEEEAREEAKGSNFLSKLKEDPWKVTSVVFILASLILLILALKPGVTGNVINEGDIGQKALDFFNTKLSQIPGTLESVNQISGVYQIMISAQGQTFPLYFTKDGNWIQQGGKLVPITGQVTQTQTQEQQQNVPKTDKPIVELFIWSYCPYGVQAQGPLAEVASLLRDYADFEAVLYYDGHGAYETQQNKIQACIQKLDKDKYWDYVSGFVEEIYPKCGSSRDIECDKTESINLMKSLGINSAKVMLCVDSEGESLIEAHSQRASELGVEGSPTFVINGVKAQVSRTAEAIKTAVCGAFNNAPEECSQTLDSGSSTAQGNC